MPERLKRETSETIELNLKGRGILESGVIEYLILSGRTPTIWEKLSFGRRVGNVKHEGYFCEIPPQGTKRTDIRKRFSSVGRREYVSRRGVSRGFSTFVLLSRDVGEAALSRIEEVMDFYDIP